MKRRFRIVGAAAFFVLVATATGWAAAAPAAVGAESKGVGDNGTTIVGDQDAAVGLYLTPWKDESAANIDRAPGLLDRQAVPVDAGVFSRQVENDDELAAYRRSRTQSNR